MLKSTDTYPDALLRLEGKWTAENSTIVPSFIGFTCL